MCKAVEEFAERRAAEAKAEGERKTMLAMAKRMLKDGVLALKDIARYTGLSLAQVKKLRPSVA
jgi:predicted transposase/invertase (TIGR01784 family)